MEVIKMKVRIPDEKNVPDVVLDLIAVGLTEKEARDTSQLFPCPILAKQVAEFYIGLPEAIKINDFSSYDAYLDRIKSALQRSQISSDEHADSFQQEVSERSRGLDSKLLMQTSYRDRPSRSGHYWEHVVTQRLE